MIYGTGIDVVEVCRMEKILGKWGDRFIGRVFSREEVSYCANCTWPAMHYAARFAAKESFLKSLGLGLGMGIRLRDVEVFRDPQGKPEIRLLGRTADMARRLGIGSVHVSLSHTRHTAAAMVVLEKT